jgi:hypothetical protein
MADDQIYIKMHFGEAVHIDVHGVQRISEAACRSEACTVLAPMKDPPLQGEGGR